MPYTKSACFHRKLRSSPKAVTLAVAILLLYRADPCLDAQAPASAIAASSLGGRSFQVGGASLQINLRGPAPDLPEDIVEGHIRNAAQAVTVYYGGFPVSSARIVIFISEDRDGMLQGTTWGNRDGFPAMTRLRLGQHTTEQELSGDWIATHELVHMALASLPDDQQWLEEGIATYVEPIARVQAGQLTPERIWGDMVAGMHNGEPAASDRGLNRTHSWGRTYWGGALFCLVADVEIRKQTGNARGLQDALRAIVEAGGTIDKDWPVERVLSVGDRATGVAVLQGLYAKWSETPVEVDLPDLWRQLGVNVDRGNITFDDSAPLAKIRVGITAAHRDK